MSRKKRVRASQTQPAVSDETLWHENSKLLEFGLPAIAGLGIFLIYLRTLAPTIVGGDTGELITVAYKMGVAHPPGYPLFTMLAKLFTFFPFGTVAWRVNLLSAVCDTGAAVMILLAVRRWALNHWAGFLAAGLFAFSPLIWRYAVVGEVFALNNLLVASMVYLAVRYSEGNEKKYAYLTAFIFGLGMSNHHTCVFYGAPIMVWILITGRRDLWTFKPLGMIAAAFIAGLLPYTYLPFADAHPPPFSWGHASTVKGFLLHVLRREYGTLQLGAHNLDTRGNFLLGLGRYFSDLPGHLIYIGLVLAVVGLYFSLRNKKAKNLALVTLIAFCLYVVVFHALANLPLRDPFYLTAVHMRFWQQATLMVCVWAGLGFGALASFIPQSRSRNLEMAAVALLLTAVQATTNFAKEDQSRNFVIRDYGSELLRPIPPGSLVLSQGDLMIDVLGYLQQCEGYRNDVTVIDQQYLRKSWMKRLVNANYPRVTIPGPYYGAPGTAGYDTRQLFDANAGRFKMYINLDSALFETDKSWEKDYKLWPFGTLKMIVSNQSVFSPYDYIKESEEALPRYNLDSLGKYEAGTWENLLLKDYWASRFNRASFLIAHGIAQGNNPEMLQAGAQGLEDITARLPGPPPLIYKQLGLAYSKLAAYDPANRAKMKAAWSSYLQMGPEPDDPDLPEIRKAVNE
jgi:dolichyl-phosphate-mannose-protein mannosyltransferase